MKTSPLATLFRPALPDDFKLPFQYTNEPELHSYPSLAIKTADYDGEGAGYRIAVCMDLVPESVAAYIVNATNKHAKLESALRQTVQMLETYVREVSRRTAVGQVKPSPVFEAAEVNACMALDDARDALTS